MHVIHVITRLIVGGAQENTVATVLGLAGKTGCRVELITGPTTGPEGSLEPVFNDAPHLLVRLPELVRAPHPWLDLAAYVRLCRRFRSEKPDIVHTHSGKAGILGRLAARKAGVPLIIHTIHGPSFGTFQGAAANAIFKNAERLAGKVTTHFISVANAMTTQYLAAGIGRPGQYTRIFSGFDLNAFQKAGRNDALRAKCGFAPDDFVVGKIARLFPLKGHDDLFDIAPSLAKAHPKIRFLLVGDGVWRARFEDRARSQGLERHFYFAGLVPPGDVPGWIGAMDVLVHLSRREGLPRALPQAMAAARPVVAFDCDGAREVCLDGKTGFLAPVGDVECLRERLLQLALDPALRRRLGASGAALAADWFPVEKMVRDIYDLYRRLDGSDGLSMT